MADNANLKRIIRQYRPPFIGSKYRDVITDNKKWKKYNPTILSSATMCACCAQLERM